MSQAKYFIHASMKEIFLTLEEILLFFCWVANNIMEPTCDGSSRLHK